MAFLNAIGTFLTSLVSLVLPVFGKARGAVRGAASTLFWVLHVIIVLAILVGLYFLNVRYLHLDRLIPRTHRFLAESWLSILFLLVYVLCWLSWWLWRLLAPDHEMSDFPDLDEAWDEAVAALNEAGISLTEAPLFLVLGQTESKDAALFQAAQVKFQVTQAPDAKAPLHVFANRDGIWVTCPGASLLARQAMLLAGETESGGAGVSLVEAAADPIDQTLRPSTAPKGAQKIHAVLGQALRKGRSPEQLTEAERRELRRLERREKPRPSLLKNLPEVDHRTARLEHVCRLIARDRWPFCPVNGLLLLVPFAATDSDQDALDTGDLLQRELTVARGALKVHCPLFTLVCDMETAPGFSEFISRFTEAERQQRMGQRTPLVPAVRSQHTAALSGTSGDESIGAMLHSVARWIGSALVPGWVYKKFRVEGQGRSTAADAVRTNSRLFLLLDELRERQSRLSEILNHGLVTGRDEQPWLFGGCYVAATGADPGTEQAFVAGVFRRLPEEQNYVSWTEEALGEEALYQSWISRGYAVLGVLFVAALGLGAYYFFGMKQTPKG
jgi:hypothetical protein